MCDSCAASYNPATAGAVGAYSGYAASKGNMTYRGSNPSNGYAANAKRISPGGIIFAIIIVIVLIVLIVWLIASFFWCKSANQSSKSKQSCEGGSCTNSSNCEAGLSCSNGVCVPN